MTFPVAVSEDSFNAGRAAAGGDVIGTAAAGTVSTAGDKDCGAGGSCFLRTKIKITAKRTTAATTARMGFDGICPGLIGLLIAEDGIEEKGATVLEAGTEGFAAEAVTRTGDAEGCTIGAGATEGAGLGSTTGGVTGILFAGGETAALVGAA